MAEALDAAQADVLVDYTHAGVVQTNVWRRIERGVHVVGRLGGSAADYGEIDARARERQVGVIAAGELLAHGALLLRFAS